MDFSGIESEEYSKKLVEFKVLRTMIQEAWKTPEMEALWDYVKTEEGRKEVIDRIAKVPNSAPAAQVLYIYALDIKDARIGPALLNGLHNDNPWNFVLYDRVIRKSL